MDANRWTMEFLEAKRSIGDPTADAVIEALFQAGDIDAVNGLMVNLVRNEALIPEQLPLSRKRICRPPKPCRAGRIRQRYSRPKRCSASSGLPS